MQQTIVGKLGQPMAVRMQDQGYDGHSRSFKWDDERIVVNSINFRVRLVIWNRLHF